MRRHEPNLPATFPPVACRGAVLRRACRMSERGATGTANRQHPFIRAGGGRWQGSGGGGRRPPPPPGKFGLPPPPKKGKKGAPGAPKSVRATPLGSLFAPIVLGAK